MAPLNSAPPGVDGCPSEQECRDLVTRILARPEFQRAPRLRSFLLYIVDRKFAGAPHETTEVFIGRKVFKRPETFNPGDDSIVRTEARILRQRLQQYFADAGEAEPILLEIPKGSYLPVFRSRKAGHADQIADRKPANQVTRRRILLAAGIAFPVAALVAERYASTSRSTSSKAGSGYLMPWPRAAVQLESSDPLLNKGFQEAKQRALKFTYTGDPVGDWYDSTAGDRHAFCMRDTSHQSTGAAVLGLAGHTRNMLRCFAASLSPTRNWCGYWEINKDGFPAGIDYRNDKDFYYCLPANFDVMRACEAQFLWTGDPAYTDSVFSTFYDQTVTGYVNAWDKNGDGWMEAPVQADSCIFPSYWEHDPRALIDGDLVGAQYKGYRVYANIQRRKGTNGSLSRKLVDVYEAQARTIRSRYNTQWWNAAQNRYYSAILPNGKYFDGFIADVNTYTLLFGITEDGMKTHTALDALESHQPEYDQTFSYAPEILFAYGRNDSAYRALLKLTNPSFRGSGMPEIVFAAIGAIGTGLMGISPNAPCGLLETLPRLPKALLWIELSRVPVLQNQVTVRHSGLTETVLVNQTGPRFLWRPSFVVQGSRQSSRILIEGLPVRCLFEQRRNRQTTVSAIVPVNPGQSKKATLLL